MRFLRFLGRNWGVILIHGFFAFLTLPLLLVTIPLHIWLAWESRR